MPRYPLRPRWHPIEMISHSPHLVGPFMFAAVTIVLWPFRYRIARFYDRQRQSPQTKMKAAAVKYYRDIEYKYRKEAWWRHALWSDDGDWGTARVMDAMQHELREGSIGMDSLYWRAHQKDVQRASRLASEIKELRAGSA